MRPEIGRRILVGLQVAAIAGALFVPGLRYLAWAPFHEPAKYRIHVRIDGRELSEDRVARRYGLPRFHRDWQLNDIRNVLEVVEAYESAARDRAEVRVDFQRNGSAPEVWRWPPTP
jgi:hypothetical protein